MLKALLVAVILLCSSCAYAWSGSTIDSDGNVSWINISDSGSGSIMNSDGTVTWINGN
jgi:hypothetical protein